MTEMIGIAFRASIELFVNEFDFTRDSRIKYSIEKWKNLIKYYAENTARDIPFIFVYPLMYKYSFKLLRRI